MKSTADPERDGARWWAPYYDETHATFRDRCLFQRMVAERRCQIGWPPASVFDDCELTRTCQTKAVSALMTFQALWLARIHYPG